LAVRRFHLLLLPTGRCSVRRLACFFFQSSTIRLRGSNLHVCTRSSDVI
jgi:hypothetical protein